MNPGSPWIVTGMHRSGTSLVASLLLDSGVDLGAELLGASRGNPRGHFEDLGFLRFHQELLATRQLSILVTGHDRLSSWSVAERTRASGLVAAREATGRWGWKEPRASLFLEEWSSLLQGARFLLVYRHPLEVVASLVRRGADFEALADPWLALRSWSFHNSRILDFFRRHRERCLLVSLPGLLADPRAFLDAARSKLGSSLDRFDPSSRLVEGDLTRLPDLAAATTALRTVDEASSRLWAELEAEADLAANPSSSTRRRATSVRARSAVERSRPDDGLALELLLEQAFPGLAAQRRADLLRHGVEGSGERVRLAEARDWSASQSARWQAIAGERQQELESERASIAELEDARVWLTEQRAHWEALATEQRQALDDRDAWIARLEDARKWLTEQRDRWEAIAASQLQALDERETRMADLESARQWLTEQRDRWEAIAGEQLRTLEERTTWIAQLEEARRWLTEQRDRWESIASEQNRTLDERAAWIAHLEEALRWFTEQRDRWEAIATDRP